jgi:hypothetical protein
MASHDQQSSGQTNPVLVSLTPASAGIAAARELADLYRTAFQLYGTSALWNRREFAAPAPQDVLAITQALRTHGGMDGRRLAEKIELICRAA